MTDFYYEYNEEGTLIPHEYERGDYINNIKGTLPSGRYSTINGFLVRIGNASGPSHYAGSDSLGEGVKGVFNPADGKTYDSRSEYYKAVKAAGCVIMGNNAPKEMAKPKVKNIDWKPAIAETLKQLSPTRKGKKR